jgi:hypothetical protein
MGGLIGGGGDGGAAAAQQQLAMQQAETARLRQQESDTRRDLGEELASKRLARARGGARMLLSEARTNPEEGLSSQTTLGA